MQTKPETPSPPPRPTKLAVFIGGRVRMATGMMCAHCRRMLQPHDVELCHDGMHLICRCGTALLEVEAE